MANKANLRLWVAALRSGTYTQGYKFMRNNEFPNAEHCCLGVMQEVALRAGHLPKGPVNWGVTSWVEPSILEEFYGLRQMDLQVNAGAVLDGSETSLTVLNDGYGWTFDQIADIVEKKWDLLTYDEIYDPAFVPVNETVAT